MQVDCVPYQPEVDTLTKQFNQHANTADQSGDSYFQLLPLTDTSSDLAALSAFTATDVGSDSQPTTHIVDGWQYPSHDEELQISADRLCVTWRSGGRVLLRHSIQSRHSGSTIKQRHYNADSRIIQVELCRFATTGNICWLVIVQAELLTVCSSEGDIYDLRLPCRVQRIWTLSEGIVIEGERKANQQQHVSNGTPVLFSLLHPLEELKPVSITAGSITTADEDDEEEMMSELMESASQEGDRVRDKNATDFFTDMNEQIVWSCDSQPLLLTYNSLTQLHKLWIIRQSAVEIAKRLHYHNLADGLRDDDEFLPITGSNGLSLHAITSTISPSAGDLPQLARRSSVNHTMDPKSPIVQSLKSNPKQRLYQRMLDSVNATLTEEGESISTELVLQCIYTEASPTSRYSKVFLAGDVSHQPILCMLDASKHQLRMLLLTSSTDSNHDNGAISLTAKTLYTVSCLDAAPVKSLWNLTSDAMHTDNPYNNDIVVVEVDHTLALYTGNQRVCVLNVNRPDGDITERTTHNSNTIDSKQAHSRRKTAPRSSLIFDDSIELDAHSLQDVDQHAAAHDICQLTYPVDRRVNIICGDDSQYRLTVETGFQSQLLTRCMQSLALWLPPYTLHAVRVDLITCIAALPEQDQYTVFVYLLQHLADISLNNTQSKVATRKLLHRPLTFSEQRKTAIGPVHLPPHLRNTATQFAEYLPASFQALHLLYEDMKLDVMSVKYAKQLAPLLYQLATRLSFVRHVQLYTSDGWLAQQLTDRVLSSHSKRKHAEPTLIDTMQWLQAAVQGQHQLLEQDQAFPSFGTNESPYERSRLLRLLYDTLFSSVGTARERAAQEAQQQFDSQQKSTMLPPQPPPARRVSRYSLNNSRSFLSPSATLRASPQSYAMMTDGFTPSLSRNQPRGSPLIRLTPSSPFAALSTSYALPRASPSNGYNAANTPSSTNVPLTGRKPPKYSPLPTLMDSMAQELPLFSPTLLHRQRSVSNAVIDAALPEIKPYEAVLHAMLEENFTAEMLDSLPFGVSVPLREALRQCRLSPPANLTSEAYRLIDRVDLAQMYQTDDVTDEDQRRSKKLQMDIAVSAGQPIDEQQDAATLPNIPFIHSNTMQSAAAETKQPTTSTQNDLDGIAKVQSAARVRFNADQRVKEVSHILSTTRPACVSIEKTRLDEIELQGGGDLAFEQQQRLLILSRRVLALPIARGMYTLRSTRPELNQAIEMPKLSLQGRIPPKNALIELDMTQIPPGYTDWPAFHNGCATGLRMFPTNTALPGGNVTQPPTVTRTWIAYNRPEVLNHSHAGLLLALGFHNHLSELSPTEFYWYLAQNHDATSVSILLGLSASRAGTMDSTISRMLTLHIPVLLSGGTMIELDLSPLVQTAALVAIGLLYQCSAHRFMCEMLVNEIGRRPSTDKAAERESYSLAAGIALGMVTLGRGGDAIGVADLRIEDRLSAYMDGGVEHDNKADHVNQLIVDKTSTNRNNQPNGNSGGDANANVAGNKPSRIKESSYVNVDVTSPGATIALALMFLQTNSVAAANRLIIPDTQFLLDFIRPEFITLRVLAKSLILWSSVDASHEWIQQQTPDIIKRSVPPLFTDSSHMQDENAPPQRLKPNKAKYAGNVDAEAIRQCYANIVNGACLAIGFRWAGTADDRAKSLLMDYARAFRAIKRRKARNAGGIAASHPFYKLDRLTLDNCITACALALSLVMAGTGDLSTFKLLRSLRQRLDRDSTYGQQMALHLPIGLLFLGGGRLTLSTSPAAIAALLVALYPRWPATTDDNRFHLQALRHMYAIAVQPRHVETRDVQTGQTCSIPIRIQLSNNRSVVRQTPCLLPPLNEIQQISLDSSDYWPVTLDLQKNTHLLAKITQSNGIVWAQRRSVASELPLQSALGLPQTKLDVQLSMFLSAFVMSAGDASSDACRWIVQHCLQVDTTAILPTLLHLARIELQLQAGMSLASADRQQLHLLYDYYQSQHRYGKAVGGGSKAVTTLGVGASPPLVPLIPLDRLSQLLRQLQQPSKAATKATEQADLQLALKKLSAFHLSPSVLQQLPLLPFACLLRPELAVSQMYQH